MVTAALILFAVGIIAVLWMVNSLFFKLAVGAVLLYLAVPTPDDALWIPMLIPFVGVYAPIVWYGVWWLLIFLFVRKGI